MDTLVKYLIEGFKESKKVNIFIIIPVSTLRIEIIRNGIWKTKKRTKVFYNKRNKRKLLINDSIGLKLSYLVGMNRLNLMSMFTCNNRGCNKKNNKKIG